jgi:hypothetical protein
MSKRCASFPRRAHDDYPTPAKAVVPLLPHIPRASTFVEPCAGSGQLARALSAAGMRHVESYDLPDDARVHVYPPGGDCFITNPPWSRPLLHPIIENLRRQKPAWLLFDADWAYTKQAAPYMPFCRKIVSVGRVRWIPDSDYDGKDNCAWYLFASEPGATLFYGRGVP